MHPCAVGTTQGSLQVQHTGKAGATAGFGRITGLPFDLRFALRVGVAELHAGQLHGNVFALDLPFDIRRQLGEGNDRLFKKTRQCQCAVYHPDAGFAARLIEIEIDARTADAGCLPHRRQFQRTYQPFDLVLTGRFRRPRPDGRKPMDQPLGRMGQQRGAGGWLKGQAVGNLRQRGQIQPVRLELASCRDFPLGAEVHHADVAARPAQSVAGVKRQRLGGKVEAVGKNSPSQASPHRLQLKRLQLRAQGGTYLGQGHVRRTPHHLTPADVDPGAHCAMALAQIDAQIGVLPQLGQVNASKGRIELAFPILPSARVARQQWLLQQRLQTEALPPPYGRRRVQPHLVAPTPVAHHQFDLSQRQRGRGPQFVGPKNSAVTDGKFELRKKPVRRIVAGVAGIRKIQPCDRDLSIRSAPDIELRALYIQLFEAKAQRRAGRYGRQNAWQAQGFAALRVKQLDVRELE